MIRSLYHIKLRYCQSNNIIKKSSLSTIVFHGDALDRTVYQKIFKEKQEKPNILITDPPYCLLTRRRRLGDLRDSKKRKLDENETITRFETVNSYKKFTQQWVENVVNNGLSKENTTIIIWTNPLGKKCICDIVQNDFGYSLQGEYIWGKRSDHKSTSNINSSKEVLLRVYETALVFKKRGVEKIDTISSTDKGFIQWSVITGYHENEIVHEHPCHKPFAAIEPLIRNFTKPGDCIFDCFAGSGGILNAAKIIGERQVLGLEKLDYWSSYCNNMLK